MFKEVCQIPQIDPNFVHWGNSKEIEQIIDSGAFFPVWLTGATGSGKTFAIEQACANLGRKMVRINFTSETSEDDLIGGFRLQTEEDEFGNKLQNTVTKFHYGSLVEAMREGAIVILDEVDAGHSNRILCLQSVLEGKGIFVKATNEWIKPEKGFNVFATSNTQGKGSDDGRYIGTNVMNSAFLDRFSVMLHQDYPETEVEISMLKKHFSSLCVSMPKLKQKMNEMDNIKKLSFAKDESVWWSKLCNWASETRDNFKQGICEEVITTRSLVNIVHSYSIFNDRDKAVKMCTDRYDSATGEALFTLYKKLTENFDPNAPKTVQSKPDVNDGWKSFKPSTTP